MDPYELQASIPGLSAAEASQIAKAPYSDHVHGVPKLAAKVPHITQSAAGLWYGQAVPMGDWSGTLQTINEAGELGSGGPAACPWPTGGVNTLMIAGHVDRLTGDADTSPTSFIAEKGFRVNPSTVAPYDGWTFTLAIRKVTAHVIAWNSAAGVGSKIAADITNDPVIAGCALTVATLADPYCYIEAPAGEDWDAFTLTGDDWLQVQEVADVGQQRGRPGWYRIRDVVGGKLQLTGDASGVIAESDTTVDVILLQSAQARYATNVEFLDADGLAASANPADGDTITFDDGITTTVYTILNTPVGTYDIQRGGTRALTMAAIAAKLAANPELEVESSTSTLIVVRSATAKVWTLTESSTALSWGIGSMSRFRLYKVGAFDPLESDDDTIEFRGGTTSQEYRKSVTILSGNADELYLEPTDAVDSGVSDAITVQWKRTQFVKRALTINPVGGTTQNKVVFASALGTAHGWNNDAPKRGDFYMVWADDMSSDLQIVTTNPEEAPTNSQRNNHVGMYPYWSPKPQARVSYSSNYGAVFQCRPGSLDHAGWSGFILHGPENFLVGDELEIVTLSDLDIPGQPVIIEALVIPGFDPEADWQKGGLVSDLERLLFANGKGMWFQSPVIRDCDTNMGCKITLRGQAGSVQTIGTNESGDNYSQQWTAKFELSRGGYDVFADHGTAGGAQIPPRGFPATVGPVAHISLTDVENFTGEAYPVTVLFATKHPSERNRPGYHGYYAREPFSPKTGNGGVLLSTQGQNTQFSFNSKSQRITKIPYSGTWRVAAAKARWIPGGMP